MFGKSCNRHKQKQVMDL
ncbi:TPA_asm: hypothetical protein GY030_14665 [Listeria monocytogenes]|nr:hypothetical protein [Listeria monocytogenes]